MEPSNWRRPRSGRITRRRLFALGEKSGSLATLDRFAPPVRLAEQTFAGVRLRVGQVCGKAGVVVPHGMRCRPPEPVRAILDPKLSAPVHLTLRGLAIMARLRSVQRHVPYRRASSAALNARK